MLFAETLKEPKLIAAIGVVQRKEISSFALGAENHELNLRHISIVNVPQKVLNEIQSLRVTSTHSTLYKAPVRRRLDMRCIKSSLAPRNKYPCIRGRTRL